jgi:hypothetical protein
MPSYWRSFWCLRTIRKAFEALSPSTTAAWISLLVKKLKHTFNWTKIWYCPILLSSFDSSQNRHRVNMGDESPDMDLMVSWCDGARGRGTAQTMILFQSHEGAVNKGETDHWHRIVFLGGMNNRYLSGSGLRWNDQCNGDSISLVALPPLLAVYVKSRGVYGHRSVASPNRTRHYIPTYLISWYLGSDIIVRCWNII